jgi:hypothetical protein
VPTSAGSDGTAALGSGWGFPEPWGVWNIGADATLVFRLATAEAGKPLRLTLWGWRLPSRSGNTRVDVRLNGALAASWNVGGAAGTPWQVTLPPQSDTDPIVVSLHAHEPTSPTELEMSDDPRPLGFALEAFRLEIGGG